MPKNQKTQALRDKAKTVLDKNKQGNFNERIRELELEKVWDENKFNSLQGEINKHLELQAKDVNVKDYMATGRMGLQTELYNRRNEGGSSRGDEEREKQNKDMINLIHAAFKEEGKAPARGARAGAAKPKADGPKPAADQIDAEVMHKYYELQLGYSTNRFQRKALPWDLIRKLKEEFPLLSYMQGDPKKREDFISKVNNLHAELVEATKELKVDNKFKPPGLDYEPSI